MSPSDRLATNVRGVARVSPKRMPGWTSIPASPGRISGHGKSMEGYASAERAMSSWVCIVLCMRMFPLSKSRQGLSTFFEPWSICTVTLWITSETHTHRPAPTLSHTSNPHTRLYTHTKPYSVSRSEEGMDREKSLHLFLFRTNRTENSLLKVRLCVWRKGQSALF